MCRCTPPSKGVRVDTKFLEITDSVLVTRKRRACTVNRSTGIGCEIKLLEGYRRMLQTDLLALLVNRGTRGLPAIGTSISLEMVLHMESSNWFVNGVTGGLV